MENIAQMRQERFVDMLWSAQLAVVMCSVFYQSPIIADVQGGTRHIDNPLWKKT